MAMCVLNFLPFLRIAFLVPRLSAFLLSAFCSTLRSTRNTRLRHPGDSRKGSGEMVQGISSASRFLSFPPTAESFGVSAQMGSGVVRGGPDARFHDSSTRVPQGFHEGSTRFCEGGVVREKEHRMLLGISPELIFPGARQNKKRPFHVSVEVPSTNQASQKNAMKEWPLTCPLVKFLSH